MITLLVFTLVKIILIVFLCIDICKDVTTSLFLELGRLEYNTKVCKLTAGFVNDRISTCAFRLPNKWCENIRAFSDYWYTYDIGIFKAKPMRDNPA